ncbi:hypothetical protein HOC_08564 [Hyphomonas oceanitis SCH89]|uniref:NadR/Ttd14 AAA domain-containing protein n=1 Tax=Hyphomonas oceanitis SCH89 TaxID=1280953 RepID=A0A059G818_9PROT|nr:hypothetical protein HOC_08564 [Hyphomonas oceanitis SCH89]
MGYAAADCVLDLSCRAIYAQDEERTLDFGALVREAYESLGFSLVDVPLAPVEGRAAFIRQRIGA